MGQQTSLREDIAACRLCADRFAATQTAHTPRPVPWFDPAAKILISGQAPGIRVHESGRPFDDRSGDRLRDWLGVTAEEFYDLSQFAIVPAAFCFPGYDAKGSDLPPPPICAQTWQTKVMEQLPNIRLRIFVGGYAHKNHLGVKTTVTQTVKDWRSFAPDRFALPHPSWRNTSWLKKNPWFTTELLPLLQATVRSQLVQNQFP